ncbi:MAG TPA: stage V sporulation protein R, partial [Thermomicrobiales bacterium]|nr:stage V sporulation protein R [Thermomicrobiales bacterium]
YIYGPVGDDIVITEKRWEAVRDRLVNDLTGYGFPIVVAVDGDYEGRRELYLRHEWTGRPLDLNWAKHTLDHVRRLWGRAVWLETPNGADESIVLSSEQPAPVAAQRSA